MMDALGIFGHHTHTTVESRRDKYAIHW